MFKCYVLVDKTFTVCEIFPSLKAMIDHVQEADSDIDWRILVTDIDLRDFPDYEDTILIGDSVYKREDVEQ